MRDIKTLCNKLICDMHVITHIPLPIDQKQISGPTHTQRKRITQYHGYQEAKVFGATLQPVCPSDAPNTLIESAKLQPFSKEGWTVNVCEMPEGPH